MNHIKKRDLLGFSLVELMIAIAILAVLISVGLVIFRNVTRSSRDEVRMQDLNSYKQALELYYQRNRAYPATKNELVPTYLASAPSDPQGIDYRYQVFPASCSSVNKNCSSYILCSTKEGSKNFNLPTACRSLSCTSGDNCMGVSSDD